METSLLSDLVTYAAQVACVVAAGSVLPLLIHVDVASVRYAYWRMLLALCLALPWLQTRENVSYALTAAVPTISTSTQIASTAVGTLVARPAHFEWLPVIGWILLVGAVLRLARVGVGLWRLRRLRTDGHVAASCEWHEEIQGTVGARAEIRYITSGQPVTFGLWRPVVLLPETLQSQSQEIQQVVLCHELFHVRRGDWMWALAEEIVRAVLWFHPGVWWLISRVRQAREEVVDELTVLATRQRRAYIEALLAFADDSPVVPTAAFARRRHLFRRMMLISKEAVMSSKRVLLSCAAMVAAVLAGSWYAVDTFPLTQVVTAQGRARGGAVVTGSEPGPIEQRAKPITPENPIPRRVFSVTPLYPSDVVDPRPTVIVTARIMVDEQGRVGEVRQVASGTGVFTMHNGAGRNQSLSFNVTPGGVGDTPTFRPSVSFVKSTVDALRQWQYDPPANGPIAFDVTFRFQPDSETELISHGMPGASFEQGTFRKHDFLQTVGGTAGAVAPPDPPAPGAPIRVGGNVALPRKIKHVEPVYPAIAQSARVQGVVIVELVINADGHVGDARVLRSIPLLDQAAIDAVKQWEFEPTRLNGNTVPVIMTATVHFSLPPQQ